MEAGAGGHRVATRQELQALAAALEAAFSSLVANIAPDNPALLVLPPFHEEEYTVAGAPSAGAVPVQWGNHGGHGTTANAAPGNGSMYGPSNGFARTSIQAPSEGANGGEFSKEGMAPGGAGGHGRGCHHFGVSGGIGGGRPSVMPAPMPNEEIFVVGDMDSVGDPDGDEDGTVAFLRERRPSFDGLVGGRDRTFAGAVLAATMRAAVQRTTFEHQHQGFSAYSSTHGMSMPGASGHGGGYTGASAADPSPPSHWISPALHRGPGRTSMDIDPQDGHLHRANHRTSVQLGSLDIRRCMAYPTSTTVTAHTVHPSLSNDPASDPAYNGDRRTPDTNSYFGKDGTAQNSNAAARPRAAEHTDGTHSSHRRHPDIPGGAEGCPRWG